MFPEVNRVLEYFLKNPTESIYVRELARQVNFSPAGCLKSLRKLVKQGFVEQHKTKAISIYKVKLIPKFLHLKKAYNIYSLFDCGLVKFLQRRYEFPDAIIVFGSYARGEDTERSDIDIVVVSRLEKSLNLKKFEGVLGRKINILELKDTKKAKKGFINSLANGIVLDGVLQL